MVKYIHCITVVLLLAIFASLASCQANKIVIPTSYSVVISVNSDQIGFTYAFREYYDIAQNKRRTDGNQTDADAINVIDYSKNIYTTFDKYKPSTCISYNISTLTPNVNMLQPSIQFLQRVDFTKAAYVGINTAARYIPSYYFINSTLQQINNNGPNGNSSRLANVTTEYFFAESTGLPVRTIVSIYEGSLVTPNFTIYYDWVNWIVSESLEASVFDTPTTCVLSQNVSRGNLPPPTNNTVNRNPLPANTPFPTVSPSFYSVLEGKDISTTGMALTQVDWYYDSNADVERADVIFSVFGFTYTSIFNYTGGFSFINFGEYCIPSRFNPVNTPFSFATTNSGEPDALYKLFVPSVYSQLTNFDVANAQYQGRYSVRGVNADTWKIPSITFRNYVFETYVYFFPQGWQFPGRTLTSDIIPMRVLSNGTYTNNSVSYSFFQEWDLFLYFSSPPDPSVLDPTTVGCPATFPTSNITVPTQYSVFISVYNVTSGVSYSYEEFTDQGGNISRKFFYNGFQFITDVNLGTVYAFFPYNQSRQCVTVPYEGQLNSDYGFVIEPTSHLNLFNDQIGFTHVSTTTSVRNILADYYTLTFPGGGIGLYVDYDTRFPLRVTFQGIVIEYLNWQLGAPNPNVFVKPTNCLVNDAFYSQISSTSNYNPTAPVNTTMPSVSNQFYMVLEGKIGETEGSSSGLVWYYDGVAQQERIEQLIDVNTNNLVSEIIYTYDYVNSRVYSYSYTNGICNNNAMVTSGSAANISLLALTRAGFVHEFFDPSFMYNTIKFNYNSATYQGITVVRGVSAPTWMYSNITSVGQDGFTYNFNAYIYFFPQGWAFPLRNLPAGARVPLGIVLEGNYSDGIESTAYYDSWDILMYNPTPPAASAFVPCALSLIPMPQTSASGSSGLSGGAKAGIAIGVIVGVLALVIGVFLARRRGPVPKSDTFKPMNDES